MRVNASADDHRCHREEHGPERRRKHLCLENFCSLNQLWPRRKSRSEILHLLACTDEVKHRHALRESHKKRGEEPEENVLRQRDLYDGKAHQQCDDKAQNRQQRGCE